jgi:hypothetical protein
MLEGLILGILHLVQDGGRNTRGIVKVMTEGKATPGCDETVFVLDWQRFHRTGSFFAEDEHRKD